MNQLLLEATIAPCTFLDCIYKLSTVVIALANFGFIIWINVSHNSKTHEQDRKMSLMKTLILDYNLDFFYQKMKDINDCLSLLSDERCNRSNVEANLNEIMSSMNDKFVDLFLAVDNKLHQQIRDKSDEFRDKIVNQLADTGVLLDSKHQQKFDDLILSPYKSFKIDMLHMLFQYKFES